MFHVKAFDFLDTYKSIIWSKKTINFVRISRYFHIQKHLLLKLSRNTEIRCGKEGVNRILKATRFINECKLMMQQFDPYINDARIAHQNS